MGFKIEFSDDVTTLPPEHPMMMRQRVVGGNGGDEFEHEINNMDPEMVAQLQAQLEDEQRRHDGNLPPDAHPLLLFLQTLLPWNRIQDNPNARPRDMEHNPIYQPNEDHHE